MNITRVTTERIRPGAHGLVVAAHVEGQDLAPRAISLIVKFGSVAALNVVPLATAEGVRAVFSQMPAAGATLFIGYANEPIQETTFKFAPPADIPVA
jgi:hypothetical protein